MELKFFSLAIDFSINGLSTIAVSKDVYITTDPPHGHTVQN